MKKSNKELTAQQLIDQVTFEMKLRENGINPSELIAKVRHE